MSDLYESQYYESSYRVTESKRGSFILYTDEGSIEIFDEISFDIKADNRSAANYFAASIACGILCHIRDEAIYRNVLLEDLEGKIKLTLSNPLTLLRVKGYDEKPQISKIDLIVYAWSDLEESEFQQFMQDALLGAFIYNTLSEAVEFNIRFVQVL